MEYFFNFYLISSFISDILNINNSYKINFDSLSRISDLSDYNLNINGWYIIIKEKLSIYIFVNF